MDYGSAEKNGSQSRLTHAPGSAQANRYARRSPQNQLRNGRRKAFLTLWSVNGSLCAGAA